MQALASCGIHRAKEEAQFELDLNGEKPKEKRAQTGRGNIQAQVVAFETHSSIGSENCSIDSIQISIDDSRTSGINLNDSQRQGVTNRRSFWGYFFKNQQTTEPRPSHQTHSQAPVSARDQKYRYGLTNKMHTIQERTEMSSTKTLESGQSSKISSRLLNFIRKPLHL